MEKIADLMQQAMTAFNEKNYSKAIECYEKVLAQDDNVFDAYFYLTASYSEIHWYEKAIETMEKAMFVRPDNAAIYYNLASLYRSAGYGKDKIEAALRKVLELGDPESEMYKRAKADLAGV